MAQVLKKENSQETLYIKYFSTIYDFKDKLKYYYVCSLENNMHCCEQIETDYFLQNNTWDASFLLDIPQFKAQESKTLRKRKIYFWGFKKAIKNDFKLAIHEMIFKKDYSIVGAVKLSRYFTKIGSFLKCMYPNIYSLLELDFKKAEIEWNSWLVENYSTTDEKRIFRQIYNYYYELIVQPEEWEKDIWNIENIRKSNHVEYNRNSSLAMTIHFDYIKSEHFRNILKKYCKQRLSSNNHFSWGTALLYSIIITKFLNEISDKNPSWTDLKELERNHIEDYLIFLNTYANLSKNKIKAKNEWILNNIITVQKFLMDIQVMEYPEATIKDVRKLIYKIDKPSVNYKSDYERIKYIPDEVLEQLIPHLRELPDRVKNAVWIMLKTGFRISDTLNLRQDCLFKIDGKYWIETDNKGNLFHFKNHEFRHTYAVKLLNCGTDIITIQELMAHASPEMTLRYARLLDDTKRRAFDNAVKNGIFTFDYKDNLIEQKNGEFPIDILSMLWTNHKLNAIETPYGNLVYVRLDRLKENI